MASLMVNSPESAAAPVVDPHKKKRSAFRHRLEYGAAAGLLRFLGFLPHPIARAVCAALAALIYRIWPRLRHVGLVNLRLAFPDWDDRRRRRVLRRLFRGFGRMLADFAHFPRWTRENIEKLIIYDGFENFARAREQGKGVLFLTAHFGNWELSSFAHGLYGYPLNFIVRELDNPLLDALINRYRCLSGGRAIEKRESAREILRAFQRGEAVGILADQNMLAAEGVFVEFFGRRASTTPAPARLARKLGVPIVFGLAIWDDKLKKYRLRFDPVEWIKRDDPEEEILANTANFTRLLEDYVRRYPDQWLWVHRRWKTRPPGEPPLYPF
ncbi:MAG: lysophospholipid acyltransferase family protein [Terriglobia bacterium]